MPFPTLRLSLPQLSYPVKRAFPWPRFTGLIVTLSIVSFIILVPLNIALTGYQTIPTLTKNISDVPKHWYDRLTQKPKPGSLCTPQNFATGDTLRTNYSIFNWVILSPNNTNHEVSYIPYKGVNLDSCDVTTVEIDANSQSATFSLAAVVRCNSTDLPLLMRTSWTPWGATSDYFTQTFKEGNDAFKGPAAAGRILSMASLDLLDAMITTQQANPSAAYSFILESVTNWCPKTFLESESYGCARSSTYNKPDFPQSFMPLGLSQSAGGSLSIVPANSAVGSANAINNILQALHSAVRLDLGYVLPNNLLTNSTMLYTSLAPLTNPGNLYSQLQTPGTASLSYPLSTVDSAVIDVTFACNFKYPKSAAEILVSVCVATFTFLSTGWAIAMFVASYLAEKIEESGNFRRPQDASKAELEDFERATPQLDKGTTEEHEQGYETEKGYETESNDIERAAPINDEKKSVRFLGRFLGRRRPQAIDTQASGSNVLLSPVESLAK